MSDSYRSEDNSNQALYPGPSIVQLNTSVVGVLGQMMVTVSGYGRVPATADAATGVMRGVIVDTDGTTGDQTANHVVTCRPGVYRFANDGTHPCAQSDVGAKVYASDGKTVGNNSGDGPLAGTLLEYNASDPQGLPCKVALRCFQ